MPFTEQDRDALVNTPLLFLDGVALQVSNSCYRPLSAGRPDRLTLDEYPAMTAYRLRIVNGDVHMNQIRCFMLRQAEGGDAVTFEAYLAEYQSGRTPLTVLGTRAQLCFTANMNGCTFGIGHQATPESGLVVTHSNSRGGGSQEANIARQRRLASLVVGPGGVLFEPEHYRTNEKNSITFGYRSPGQRWRFASLAYRVWPGNRITSYGVRNIVTNQVQL